MTALIQISGNTPDFFWNFRVEITDAVTRSAGAAHSPPCLVDAYQRMAAAELDVQCPFVSLDSSCDSSSFDGDDCATTAQKVTDLVLPHILGVNPIVITSRYKFSDAPFDIRIGATVALTD